MFPTDLCNYGLDKFTDQKRQKTKNDKVGNFVQTVERFDSNCWMLSSFEKNQNRKN